MQLEIIVSIPYPKWLTDLPDAVATGQRAVSAALADADLGCPMIEVGVTLSDDDHLRRLNRDYRGQDRVTNVLSFSGTSDLDPAPSGAELPAMPRMPQMPQIPLLLGDIVLAHGVVKGEARAQGKTLQAHFCHLLVHGSLHLLGQDHAEAGDAKAMEAREIAILAGLGIADPYRPRVSDRPAALDLP